MESHFLLPIQGINAVILLLITPIAGQAAQDPAPEPAEKQQTPWTALGLERTNLGGSSFYYEKSLVSKGDEPRWKTYENHDGKLKTPNPDPERGALLRLLFGYYLNVRLKTCRNGACIVLRRAATLL